MTFWDVVSGRYLSSAEVSDGCGVAPGAKSGEFLASSGLGGVVVVDARSGTTRPLAVGGFEADPLGQSSDRRVGVLWRT